MRRKWTFWSFREYETGALAEYLEEMAGKGWIFQKVMTGTGILVFVRGEPRRQKYNVVVLKDSSEFESPNREEARRFRELCEEAGWHLADGGPVFQIFYSEEEAPIAIETDQSLQLEAQKSVSMTLWNWTGALLILALGAWAVNLNMKNPGRTLSSWSNLSSILLMLMLMAVHPGRIISSWLWYRRAERKLEQGERLPEVKMRHVRARNSFFAVYALALLLYLIPGQGLAGGEILMVFLEAVILVTICSLVLIWVRENGSGDRRENMAGYLVGCIFISMPVILMISEARDHFFPHREQEKPGYEVQAEFPVSREDLGFEKDKNVRPRGQKTWFASFCEDGGVRRLEGGKKETVDMDYYSSPIPWVIRKTKREYIPSHKGNVWTPSEVSVPEEAAAAAVDCSVTAYRYRMTYDGTEEEIEEILGDWREREWDTYVISDRNRLWVLEFSDIPDDDAVRRAVELFSGSGQ